MTLSLFDAGCGPSSPSPGPGWPRVLGAALVAASLLFGSGFLRCTAPVVMPPHVLPDSAIATDATTWPHLTTEGNG